MSRPAYRLGEHVHACVSERRAVLLDLRRDAYFGMDAEQTRALCGVVEGWPLPGDGPGASSGNASGVPPGEALELAAELERRGLLTSARSGGRLATRHSVPAATDQLIPWEQMSSRHIRVSHVFRFLKSALIAAALLRFHSLRFVVERAVKRKAACSSQMSPLDRNKACEIVSAFYYLRAFVYGKKKRCLFDSATLLELLSCYGIYPQWVIGVQAQPFSAHSWVQAEASVLNGTPEFVGAYTPILVV